MSKCKSKVSLPADDPYHSCVIECELREGHGGKCRNSSVNRGKKITVTWEDEKQKGDSGYCDRGW